MPGTPTYTQPISKTMEHNVNLIINDNKTKDEKEAGLKPQNKNADLSLMQLVDRFTVTKNDTVEKEEDEELYEDYDKKQSSGLKITWRPTTGIYDIELFFHGRNRTDDSEFSFEPHVLNQLQIEEEFIENYADHVSVSVTLTPTEMLLLVDNYRNLKAHLYIRRMIPDTEEIDKENPVLDKDYMVILKDKELRKRISKQALVPNNELEKNDEHHNQQFTNVEFQLFSETEYDLKSKRFHFILTEATVKDAICYGVKQLGISKISMPTPENETKYVNLIIPPQQSFLSFINFLQDRYGVYNEGCNFYYQDDIMFIYPPYKRTVEDCPETTHFYCTGSGSYEGVKFYHAKDQNNSYHIVINKNPVMKELIDSGAEKFGNEILFEHADQIIDLNSYIKEGEGAAEARMGMGEIAVKETNTTIFSWEKRDTKERDYGIVNSPLVREFIFTNNMMKYKSSMKAYRGSLCGFEWAIAEPFFLRPGYAVKWHIDGERDKYDPNPEKETRDTMEYKTYDGIARTVIYKLKPASASRASRYPFSCTATVMLDLDYLPAKQMSDPADTITNEFADVGDQTDSAYAIQEKYDASISQSSSTIENNRPKYKVVEGSQVVKVEIPVAELWKTVSNVYLISYRKVTDGIRIKYELTWSDGTTSYIDTNEPIPKYKTSESGKSLFDL